MTQDVLTGIGDLIDKLYVNADILHDMGYGKESFYDIILAAATTIDILAERIIDSENNSALRVYALEQKLLTTQAYSDYLEKRLDDSNVGFVKLKKELFEKLKDNQVPISVMLSLGEGQRKASEEFTKKYGVLVFELNEDSSNVIQSNYLLVASSPDAILIKEAGGQFTGGFYTEVWKLKNQHYFFDISSNEAGVIYWGLKLYGK